MYTEQNREQNRAEGLFTYKHIIYKYMWSSHYWLLTQKNKYKL